MSGGERSQSIREIAKRVQWLCDNKVDASRGPSSAAAREAKALMFALDEIVDEHTSPAAMEEHNKAQMKWGVVLAAWNRDGR